MPILAHRHTAIIVENLDIMIEFYVALGFKQTRRDLEQGEFISHLIGLENAILETVKLSLPNGYIIELIKYLSHPPSFKPQSNYGNHSSYCFGYDHEGFTIDNIDDVVKIVISMGGRLLSPPKWTNPGLPSIHAYVTDPEKNIIHLAQNVSA